MARAGTRAGGGGCRRRWLRPRGPGSGSRPRGLSPGRPQHVRSASGVPQGDPIARAERPGARPGRDEARSSPREGEDGAYGTGDGRSARERYGTRQTSPRRPRHQFVVIHEAHSRPRGRSQRVHEPQALRAQHGAGAGGSDDTPGAGSRRRREEEPGAGALPAARGRRREPAPVASRGRKRRTRASSGERAAAERGLWGAGRPGELSSGRGLLPTRSRAATGSRGPPPGLKEGPGVSGLSWPRPPGPRAWSAAGSARRTGGRPWSVPRAARASHPLPKLLRGAGFLLVSGLGWMSELPRPAVVPTRVPAQACFPPSRGPSLRGQSRLRPGCGA